MRSVIDEFVGGKTLRRNGRSYTYIEVEVKITNMYNGCVYFFKFNILKKRQISTKF